MKGNWKFEKLTPVSYVFFAMLMNSYMHHFHFTDWLWLTPPASSHQPMQRQSVSRAAGDNYQTKNEQKKS